MKLVTGKELMEQLGPLHKHMEDLRRICEGQRPCPHCEGTGWITPERAASPEPNEEERK